MSSIFLRKCDDLVVSKSVVGTTSAEPGEIDIVHEGELLISETVARAGSSDADAGGENDEEKQDLVVAEVSWSSRVHG